MPDYPQEAQPQNLPFQVEAEQAFLGCLLLAGYNIPPKHFG